MLQIVGAKQAEMARGSSYAFIGRKGSAPYDEEYHVSSLVQAHYCMRPKQPAILAGAVAQQHTEIPVETNVGQLATPLLEERESALSLEEKTTEPEQTKRKEPTREDVQGRDEDSGEVEDEGQETDQDDESEDDFDGGPLE